MFKNVKEWVKFTLFVPVLVVYVIFSTVSGRFPNKVTVKVDKELGRLVRRLSV